MALPNRNLGLLSNAQLRPDPLPPGILQTHVRPEDFDGLPEEVFSRRLPRRGSSCRSTHSSFERLSEEELEAHLGVQRYGRFTLTDAIRPSYDLKIVPRQGYRHDFYVDEESKTKVPVLMAAASRENLFDIFLELIEPLGNEVDVVLETSHNREAAGHTDLYREHIDLPVFKSMLWDYEDLLMNDGCTGIAVLNPAIPQEVQFDEHKLLDRLWQAAGRLRNGLQPLRRPPRRRDEVHHRSRARPFLERPLRAAVRRADDVAGHGQRVLDQHFLGQHPASRAFRAVSPRD